MAINFTDSPSNGATITANGKTYTYESSSAKWKASAADSSGGGGVTTYANIAALPSSGNTGGDLVFVTDVKAAYMWDGTEWDRLFSGQNMLPEFTTSPAASYDLATDGTATTVTVAATDPEGFAVTYSHDTSPSNQAQATITQSGGTFTVTPSTSSSNEGTFTARFKAFDGVRTNSVSSTFNLEFWNPNTVSGLVGWWDFGNSSSYGGSGTTVNDISTNSNNITGILNSTYTASSTAHSVPTMQFALSGYNGNFTIPDAVTTSSGGKTYIVIFYYDGWNGSTGSGNIPWSVESDSSSYYTGLIKDGDTVGAINAGFTAESGQSIQHRVNGSTVLTTRDAIHAQYDFSKYNTFIASGLAGSQAASTSLAWQAYWTSNDWKTPTHVRAVLVYDSVVSTANMELIHDYYRGLLGSSNMTAWS